MKDFKGLFTDTGYLKNPEGTWQNAKNILLTKQFNSPVNENGTKYVHTVRGNVRGIIDTNTEIVYFSVIEDSNANSLISVYNINTKNIKEVLKGNFNFKRPIEGVYKYDYKNDLIVSWCDGVFEDSASPKIVKLTNINLPLINTNVLEDAKIPLIELFPVNVKGTIEAQTIQGSIDGLFAFVTFKYGRENEEGAFQNINTYATLTELSDNLATIVTKGFKVVLKDLDYFLYDYIKLGIHIVGEDTDTSYITKRITISSSEKEIEVKTLIGLEEISNEELLVPQAFFSKIESMTLHKDSILALNVSKKDNFKFQKYAGLLNLVPRTAGETPLESPPSIVFNNNDKFLMFNEVYNFNIQLDLHNGETTEWFHIPNNNFFPTNRENIWDGAFASKYELENNRFNPLIPIPEFRLVNRGTYDSFGYWENVETYPNNDEYNSSIDYEGNPMPGLDLRGLPIRFHRIMEEPRENTGKNIIDSFAVVGAVITNFNTIVPTSIRKQIKNIRLGVTKRTFGNSLIVAEGLIFPTSPIDRLSDETYLNNDNADLSTITPTIPNDVYRNNNYNGYACNHFIFLSPEMEERRPLISLNTLYFKRFITPDTFSYNDYRTIRSIPLTGGIDDQITFKDLGDLDKEYNQNKYYNAPFNYNYKLANNSAQGSKYLDGGLFMSNTKNVTNFYSEETDFIPFKKSTFSAPTFDKTIIVSGSLVECCAMIVDIMDIKENLYTLRETEIISSKNTITLINDVIPSISDKSVLFKIGDVSYGKVVGGLSIVMQSLQNAYTSVSLNVKLISNYSASALKVLNTLNREVRDLNIADPVHVAILESKQFGYSVLGNIKNGTVNTLAKFPSLDLFDVYVTKFPKRIIRSSLSPNESRIINSFRDFKSNDYYELTSGKGEGVAIRSNDNEVYIQLRFSLLYAKIKDVLKTRDGEAFLQTRDLFENTPISLTSENKGFIGCEHKFACKITKEGYITIDHKRGNIILANPSITIISSKGIRNQLFNSLEYVENEYYETSNGERKAIDDPYAYIGFSLGYDYEFNLLFVTKLYPEKVIELENRLQYYEKLLGDTTKLSLPPTIETHNKSFTLSFSLDGDVWVGNHDLVPNRYIEVGKNLFAFKNTKDTYGVYNIGVIHATKKGKKGEYFGIKYRSYIDIIFNGNVDLSKILNNIELITTVINSSKGIEKHKTINTIAVFNDSQCSGELDLDTNNYDIVRNVEDTWNINNFRDLVINPSLPILKEGEEINIENLSYSKKWYDKSYFIGKFIVVRLIWNNIEDYDIYINEVKVNSKISKR